MANIAVTPEQRLLVLDAWRRSGVPAGDFAPLVGISRHTLYAWKHKFDLDRPAGLLDHPRGWPAGSRLPDVTRRAIVMLKESNPDWGGTAGVGLASVNSRLVAATSAQRDLGVQQQRARRVRLVQQVPQQLLVPLGGVDGAARRPLRFKRTSTSRAIMAGGFASVRPRPCRGGLYFFILAIDRQVTEQVSLSLGAADRIAATPVFAWPCGERRPGNVGKVA